MHWTDERIKLLRRNSLRNEVDGIWEGLEEQEDRDLESNNSISHSECLMLSRVLSDKAKLPRSCMSSDSPGLTNTSASDTATIAHPAHLPDFMVRLTAGAPGHHMDAPHKKELGGPVSMRECQTLAQYLKPSVGGTYLLPTACSSMLNKAEDAEKTSFEAGNADVYKRLKRRQTQVAREDYPPTYV